jgi:nitrate reductase beta subunit
VAVENFQMLKQRQTADDLSGDDAAGRDRTRGRVNLLNWDGKGSPRGLFPKKPPEDQQ